MAEKTWPPPAGLCTPTVSANDSILTLSSTVTINAPAAVIWEALRDTSRYPEWNSFCPKVTVQSQPDGSSSPLLQLGTMLTLDAVMDPKKPQSVHPTQLRVMDISTPEAPSSYVSEELLQQGSFTTDLTTIYRISWKVQGGFASRGLRSERFHEIIVRGDDVCEVRSWETQGGILARAVKWTYGSVLVGRFQDWADDLKRQSEEIAAGKQAAS